MKTEVSKFEVGDTVDVHCRILEGEKERIQIFNGWSSLRAGSGSRATFTVRRIVQGEGVERKFPLNSPRIAAIEVKRSASPAAQALLSPRPHGQGRPLEREVAAAIVLPRSWRAWPRIAKSPLSPW